MRIKFYFARKNADGEFVENIIPRIVDIYQFATIESSGWYHFWFSTLGDEELISVKSADGTTLNTVLDTVLKNEFADITHLGGFYVASNDCIQCMQERLDVPYTHRCERCQVRKTMNPYFNVPE